MLGFRGAAALFGALAVAIAAIAVVVPLAGGACSIYDPSLLLPAADGGGPEAGDAGMPDVREAEAAPPPCPEVFPPPPPAMDDPSDAGDQSFVVALHTIDVGLSDAGTTRLGYDLDKVWTGCSGGGREGGVGPESCKAAVTGAMHPDDPGGRDDYAGKLLGALASVDSSQFNTSTVSQRLENGTYSVLLQVLHYNGTPNDTQVTIGLYASNGVENDAGALWNGKDTWTVDSNFAVNDAGPPVPLHFDANAYVSGGTVVMHVNFPLSLGTSSTGSFAIVLSGGLITGTVVPVGDGTYRLTGGQITGRWNVGDLLSAVQALTVSLPNPTPVCPGTTPYTLIKGEACQYADIMTSYMDDNTGATCDALSLGIGYTADPALMGNIVSGAPRGSLCYPEGGAPDAADSCQKP